MEVLDFARWGIILQIIGVMLGAYGIFEIVLRPKNLGQLFSQNISESEIKKLPKDNKGKTIFPIRINRWVLSISFILIIAGLGLQLVSLG